MLSNSPSPTPLPENRAVYEIMWKNNVQGMRICRWIPKATNTHSYYVILTACPLEQQLRERA